MTVNRTTLLDLPLPVTGTESGTWGDTTNNGLTQYMDIAIAGMSNLTSANFTTGALTIETTEGNSSGTNISATSAQYAGFRVTSLAQNSTITVGNTGTSPARSYRLINADATYTLTFKATGQTGITLQPGQTAVVAFNGTDYVIVGMAGAGTVTDNAVVRFDGTTGKLVQNSVVTIADSTGDVAGVGALTMGGNLTLNGGTANGVLYLNGSKVATSGSALTFDGTNLATTGTSTGLRLVASSTDASGSVLQVDTTATAFGRVGGSTTMGYVAGTQSLWTIGGTEQMRLTSTGLGIGTSSPSDKLDVFGGKIRHTLAGGGVQLVLGNSLNAVSLGSVQANGDASLAFYTNTSTERMRLDSSGNLGLGVTPSAWYASGSGWKALQVGAFGILSNTATNDSRLMSNAYLNTGGSYIYLNSSQYATNYIQISGQHQWFTAASGTAGNTISFTQAMTLDASGNLMVGMTSANEIVNIYKSANTYIGLYNSTTGTSGSNGGYLGLAGSNLELRNKESGNVTLWTANTERARITSGGDLLVGTTSVPSSSSGGAAFVPSSVGRTLLKLGTTTTSGAGLVEFYNPNGMIGEISVNGSTTTYSTSSDYRLKNTIAPMTGALAKVALLKPCTYKWNVDGSDGEGFIAHELAEVVPQCVTGEKDGVDAEGKPVYQGVDTSFLVATLTAAIQEQQALITSLTARVALLEGN